MAAAKSQAFFTENFTLNLDSLEAYLQPGGQAAFQKMLGRLIDDIAPMLCRFPQSGRSFFAQPVRSIDGQNLVERLLASLSQGDDLRELIVDDYLVLYLVRNRRIYFLAIKHHRQLSFDLRRFWPS
jgi:ParE-like toxin of type II ParDE toxin-antitoxin system